MVVPTISHSSAEPVAARNPARGTPGTSSAELVGVRPSTPDRPTPMTGSAELVGVRLLGPRSLALRSCWVRGSHDWPDTGSAELVGHEEPGSAEPTPELGSAEPGSVRSAGSMGEIWR